MESIRRTKISVGEFKKLNFVCTSNHDMIPIFMPRSITLSNEREGPAFRFQEDILDMARQQNAEIVQPIAISNSSYRMASKLPIYYGEDKLGYAFCIAGVVPGETPTVVAHIFPTLKEVEEAYVHFTDTVKDRHQKMVIEMNDIQRGILVEQKKMSSLLAQLVDLIRYAPVNEEMEKAKKDFEDEKAKQK